jgi:beta-lactamase regulating signal transducer with metallopeptidase domain
MTLLLESALRSLLLGLLVWALLKLLRMRDTGTETLIWTLVLMVALSMPLLSHYLPRLSVTLPHLSATTPAAGGLMVVAKPAASLLWFARYGEWLLFVIYLVGLAACLGRLLTGLFLTWRLFRRAQPVHADWVRGRRIRASATLKSPASLARTIVLPADFPTWGAAKREAVLAHEAAHIERRDFFVQLAASLHCALFWFSPFAWWLKAKLAEIAESASDDAAVRRLNDPLLYAEILVDVARCAHAAPLIVAMAKGPLIQQRVDRILCATATRQLSAPVRVLLVAVLSGVALTVATARAAVGEGAADGAPLRPVHVTATRSQSTATPTLVRRAAAARTRKQPGATPTAASHAADRAAEATAVSYDPRALLTPVYIAARAYVPASTIEHAGRTFYIRSTERPVADVALTDGSAAHGK